MVSTMAGSRPVVTNVGVRLVVSARSACFVSTSAGARQATSSPDNVPLFVDCNCHSCLAARNIGLFGVEFGCWHASGFERDGDEIPNREKRLSSVEGDCAGGATTWRTGESIVLGCDIGTIFVEVGSGIVARRAVVVTSGFTFSSTNAQYFSSLNFPFL